MKGLVFYYSGSGNTRLACKYISRKLQNIQLELFDIVKADELPDLDSYDIIGFATFTDFCGQPFLFKEFLKKIPPQKDKIAFIFLTYGFLFGNALRKMSKLVRNRGFKVIAGFALNTPESYPPANVRGIGNMNNPREKELENFNSFISNLDGDLLDYSQKGSRIVTRKIKTGVKNTLFGYTIGDRMHSPTRAREDMGEKFVDEKLCTECGRCAKGCPYNAITLNPKPQFDMTKCYGCWYCYNHCPEKAIYTNKFRGEGHYPRPSDQLRKKLQIA
ncbi:MAG: EFR1 family ferrodoxin [Candidatus Hodarchaeales archaeon]